MKYICLLILLFSSIVNAEIVDELQNDVNNNAVSDNTPLKRSGFNLRSLQKAFETSDPKHSVYTCRYDKNSICKIRLREYMNTMVILPENDAIDTFDLGDTENFEFYPVIKDKKNTHYGSLRNTNPGADTSLTIISKNGYVYTFYIKVDDINSIFVPDMKVYVINPDLDKKELSEQLAFTDNTEKKDFLDSVDTEYLRSLDDVDISKIEFRYKAESGDLDLMPANIFDDGLWTYFQYSTNNLDYVDRVPALYKVVDGVDTPINMRVVNGTLIAESTSDAWTLRSGESHLCIRSNDYEKSSVVVNKSNHSRTKFSHK